MKWTVEVLQAIELMGASGKTPDMIALEYNMTQTQLDDERAKNENLNVSLNRAQENAERFAILKLWSDCLNGKNNTISKEMFLELTRKHNNSSDNEIIIRRV